MRRGQDIIQRNITLRTAPPAKLLERSNMWQKYLHHPSKNSFLTVSANNYRTLFNPLAQMFRNESGQLERLAAPDWFESPP
jgi:hypothetical protein